MRAVQPLQKIANGIPLITIEVCLSGTNKGLEGKGHIFTCKHLVKCITHTGYLCQIVLQQ